METDSSLPFGQLSFSDLMISVIQADFDRTLARLQAQADERQSCIDYEAEDHEYDQYNLHLEYVVRLWS